MVARLGRLSKSLGRKRIHLREKLRLGDLNSWHLATATINQISQTIMLNK